jgi:hypothetical protein
MGITEHDFYLPEEHRCFFVIFAKKKIRVGEISRGHAPAAVAFPSWDTDVLPVREITQFQSKSESLYPNAPHPPTGTGGARRGLHKKKEVFSSAPDVLKKSPEKNQPNAI